MSWHTTRLVEFSHCDPAGIVFYPKYFEMINSVIEEFFRDFVGHSFAPMHFEEFKGVPTVKISSEFHHPSRLEDLLDFTLEVPHLGTSSIGFEIRCFCQGELRFVTNSTLVRTDLKAGKSEAWPADYRAKFNAVSEAAHV